MSNPNKTIFLWYDVETTGLDPVNNDIVQFAGVITRGFNDVLKTFDVKMRPCNLASVQLEALRVQGRSLDEIRNYAHPEIAANRIMSILDDYVDKYDSTSKMQLAGFNNAAFDDQFLRNFWKKIGDDYFGSYFFRESFDVLRIWDALVAMGRYERLKPRKLAAIYNHLFNKDLHGAHDALADVKATAKVGHRLISDLRNFKEEK